jgi:diguanylate cyclase (GGDEF)-like protein
MARQQALRWGGTGVLLAGMVTWQVLARRAIRRQAATDPLTGLVNRARFIERVVWAMTGPAAEAGTTLALIDLDDFKAVNDRLGHGVGDEVLVAVAERLRRCVRSGDSVARLGDDEFAVLLQGVSPELADRIAERIITALKAPVDVEGRQLLVHASLGLADGERVEADELLRRADVAMYAAKAQGKGRWVRFESGMDACAGHDARLGADLRRAVQDGEFFLLYQPVVALPGGGLRAVEALVRWRHPERGLVSPAEFIPAAERNGMIIEIGAWVLGEACRQMADWRQRYGAAAPERMSVNVSARQLRETAFVQTVADVLAETTLDPAGLLLEITETAVFDGGVALETVRAVHALGVSIALDDFGTGHSSLSLLRTCPIVVVKVDKSFIDDVTGTPKQSVIATALAQIAQVMHLHAVAEGVETELQARKLHQLGYRLAQGFHFARPLPPQEIEALLTLRAEGGLAAIEPPTAC